MAKILLVDDNEANGKLIISGVESGCHDVTWVQESYWEDAAKKVADAAKNREWDILILDIHYPNDKEGGIWLYHELVQLGLRKKWRDTIVYSIYVTPGWETSEDDEMAKVLSGFTKSAGIPPNCVLSSSDFDKATLVEKCDELMRQH
ncbi:MAG TPA: response regulator [Verrucomicrobiae bacterium]|nr:response regulator [Verrucomicrobiae bacterium]